MTMTDRSHSALGALVTAGLVMILFALATVVAGADSDAVLSLERKVKVMERVLDEIMEQSPNVTVSPGGATRGLILDEYGALFTVEASLRGGLFEIAEGRRGVYVLGREALPRPRSRSGDDEDGAAPEFPSENWQEEARKKTEEKLANFRQELVNAVVDYGATLAELRDDQWITIAAFLDGHGPFGTPSDDHRLVLKVTMRDLRQLAAGSLSREALVSRVKVEER